MPTHPSRSRTARPSLRRECEPLEPRLALSGVPGGVEVALIGTTLTVRGTNAADRIAITSPGHSGAIRVVADGVASRFAGVGAIEVDAGAGDDAVRVGPRVTAPTRVGGGSGRDRLRAGAGPHVLRGGDGDDLIVGGGGGMALDGGSGRDRVAFARTLGTLRVAPSASGGALGILRRGYRLAPLRAGAGPIVVASADLDDARVVRQVRAAYDSGQTVALIKARPEAVERLRAIVGHESAPEWGGSARAPLVAFRRVALDGARSQSESTVVTPRQDAEAAGARGGRLADRRVLERLTSVFSASPVVAQAPPGVQNLLNLASASLSRGIATNKAGDEVQVVNTVYSARSFLNQADFYYVLQEADYHTSDNASPYVNFSGIRTALTSPATNPGILQPSPQTTMDTTSVTSGVSYTIGGSIGFNESQGFNASISASVTVSNSTTTTYPPISVVNAVNLATGVLNFGYSAQNAANAVGATLTYYNQWIWQVPFSAYAPGQTTLSFATQSDLYERNEVPVTPAVQVMLTSKVPTPFGSVFALQPPRVKSANPGTVREGDTFTVTGSGFYPSLVTGVLIGGEPIATANYQVVSDTEITVVAPDSAGFDEPVVVQTTQGVSNDDVTIDVYP